MVWSAPDLAWQANLAAAKAYYQQHGTLCAPQTAAVEGVAVGQWLTNCRRPGGLGKAPERAGKIRPFQPPVHNTAPYPG